MSKRTMIWTSKNASRIMPKQCLIYSMYRQEEFVEGPLPDDADPDAIWSHDSDSEDEQTGYWSVDIANGGLARSPYADTHLGLRAHTWWGGRYGLSGWDYRTHIKGLHTYTTLEEKQAIPVVTIAQPTDPSMRYLLSLHIARRS